MSHVPFDNTKDHFRPLKKTNSKKKEAKTVPRQIVILELTDSCTPIRQCRRTGWGSTRLMPLALTVSGIGFSLGTPSDNS